VKLAVSSQTVVGVLQVMEVYQDMLRTGCERSVITYSALISACEKAGQWQLALNLFGEMLRERCAPNVITYNSLITACAQVRRVGLLT
jgi:pentatricopeptide repeat domain-containing protein 1